jgi:hypothetical protein
MLCDDWIMMMHLFNDLSFDKQDLVMRRIEQIRVDLDAGSHHRVVGPIGDAYAITGSGYLFGKRPRVVLVAGVLNVGQEFCAPTNKVQPSAKLITGGSRLLGIRVGLWQHPSPE